MVKEIKNWDEIKEITDDFGAIIVCPHCGRRYFIDWTEEETKAMIDWEDRKLLIQDALPNRNANERELMRYAWSGLPMIACSDECLKEQYGDCEE